MPLSLYSRGDRRRAGSRLATALCALGAAAMLTSGPVATARADDGAATMAVNGHVDTSGMLNVEETLTFASGAPKQLVQRLATTEDILDYSHHVFTIDEITAKAGGVDLAPTVTTDGTDKVITVDTSKAAGKPVTIGYRVKGAAHAVPKAPGQGERTEVSWRVLQGLSVPVRQVSGSIQSPGTITYVNCESGTVATMSPCSTFAGGTHESPQPSFTDGPRAANEVVTLSFGVPAGIVAANAETAEKWTLDRAFEVSGRTLLASLLPLLLGGALLWFLHRRIGRDIAQPHGAVTPVAEFTPVGMNQSRFTVLADVRPGHVGTVADERVDPVDVTATLLDLAVRGWLRIVELPRGRARQPLDWRFARREDGEGELRPFEQKLRDAVAPAEGAGVTVSQITPAVASVVGQVQHELYDDVVSRGWFERRPDATRSRWSTTAMAALVLAVVATGLLVAFTHYALVGVALVVLALGAMVVAQEMPRRTASGTALLGGLAALASQLQTQPTHHLPAGEEYAELSRILPYAVVLGGRERWLDALVQADDDEDPDGTDLDWYHAPADWHLRDLPDSLTSFIVTLQGRLFGR